MAGLPASGNPEAALQMIFTCLPYSLLPASAWSWGWDSDNETWFFVHTLYMLCCRNNSLKTELPLLIKFTGAGRHDSKNFLYAIDDFGRHLCGLSPKNICLDSAHDNIPTYELLEHWDINALVDINSRTKSSYLYDTVFQ